MTALLPGSGDICENSSGLVDVPASGRICHLLGWDISFEHLVRPSE